MAGSAQFLLTLFMLVSMCEGHIPWKQEAVNAYCPNYGQQSVVSGVSSQLECQSRCGAGCVGVSYMSRGNSHDVCYTCKDDILSQYGSDEFYRKMGLEYRSMGFYRKTLEFDGQCRYGNDRLRDRDWMREVFVADVDLCRQACQTELPCTAYAWDASRKGGACDLYRGGPYTKGSGAANTKCYVLQETFSIGDKVIWTSDGRGNSSLEVPTGTIGTVKALDYTRHSSYVNVQFASLSLWVSPKTLEGAHDRWYASGQGESCGQGCQSRGLFCNEASLFAHNGDVDSAPEMLDLISRVGGHTNAASCSGKFGSAGDAPVFSSSECYFSASFRPTSSFDCAHSAGHGQDRLCYCSKGAEYWLVKSKVECRSGDTYMGSKASVQERADSVKAAGGEYFIYGTGSKAGKCYQESTKHSVGCLEGWKTNSYDFYSLRAKFAPHVCASEGEVCSCDGEVHYGPLLSSESPPGAQRGWSDKKVVSGQVMCSNDKFGDPAPYTKKQCVCLPAVTHTYKNFGAGYCTDAQGRRPSYYFGHFTESVCRAQCDSDTHCVAYTFNASSSECGIDALGSPTFRKFGSTYVSPPGRVWELHHGNGTGPLMQADGNSEVVCYVKKHAQVPFLQQTLAIHSTASSRQSDLALRVDDIHV